MTKREIAVSCLRWFAETQRPADLRTIHNGLAVDQQAGSVAFTEVELRDALGALADVGLVRSYHSLWGCDKQQTELVFQWLEVQERIEQIG